MRVLVLAAVLLALGGLASAQTGVVQSSTGVLLSDLGGPVEPGTFRNMTVKVTYRHGIGAVAATPTEVTLEAVEVPPWAQFTLEPTTFTFDVDPATQDEQSAEAFAVLTIDPKAPAFQRGNLTVVARAVANGNVRESQGQSQIFVIPGFNATMRIDAPDDMRIRGGTAAVLPFLVTNLGNADAEVEIGLPSKPETARVELAPTSARMRPGESIEGEVRLRASWVETAQGILTIEVKPKPAGRTLLDVEPTIHDVLVTAV
ncbi:MAG TPA: hypothetical protein VI997_06710, partial [Candidatus Thermoplasmatota archaeon]|nr:hypothetical protein [Candidatus Thermoplasmatota archaeon]